MGTAFEPFELSEQNYSLNQSFMKALVYYGARDVRVSEVPDPKIEQPTDVLVRITTTNICGSDLHMYEGRTNMEEGRIFGHENLGEVIEVGNVVVNIKVGDMVCMRFNIGCGHCKNCESGLTAFLTPSRSRFYKSSCDQLAFALQILIG